MKNRKNRIISEPEAAYTAKAPAKRAASHPSTPRRSVSERSRPAKRRRALELATDLMIDVYGPALRELEKH